MGRGSWARLDSGGVGDVRDDGRVDIVVLSWGVAAYNAGYGCMSAMSATSAWGLV